MLIVATASCKGHENVICVGLPMPKPKPRRAKKRAGAPARHGYMSNRYSVGFKDAENAKVVALTSRLGIKVGTWLRMIALQVVDPGNVGGDEGS